MHRCGHGGCHDLSRLDGNKLHGCGLIVFREMPWFSRLSNVNVRVLKDWTCINSPNMNHSSSVVVLNCQYCRVTISCHYCCNITADGVLSKQSNITFWKSEPFSSSRMTNCTTEWCVVLRRLYGNTLQNCRYSVYHEASLTLRICNVKNLTLKLWTCLTPFLNDLSSCHVFLEKKL